MADTWNIRDKLCLASCVLRFSEDWSLISRQMKLCSESDVHPEYFSQKNCAQQYTSLLEWLSNSHKLRKRSSDSMQAANPSSAVAVTAAASDGSSAASQLVHKLTVERQEELRAVIGRQKAALRKLRREIEAIRSGEMDEHIESVLAAEEQKKQLGDDDTPLSLVKRSVAAEEQVASGAAKPSSVCFAPPTTPLFIGHADSSAEQTSPSCSPPRLVYAQISPTKSVIRSPLHSPSLASPNKETSVQPPVTEAQGVETVIPSLPLIDVKPRRELRKSAPTPTTINIAKTAVATATTTTAPAAACSPRRRSETAAEAGGGRPSVVPTGFADVEGYKAWRRSILSVLGVATGHKHANLFSKPVSDEQAPFYSKFVRRPMCLSELKKKVDAQAVLTAAEFKRDLLLVFANAVMYNPRGHEVHCMALSMAADTLPRMQDLLDSLAAAEAPSPHTATRTGRLLSVGTTQRQSAPGEASEKLVHRRKRDLSETSSLDGSPGGQPAAKRRPV